MKKLIVQKQKLIENIENLKARAAQSGTRLIGMLKGNGYGLGACQFAGLLLEHGVNLLAVSEFAEAQELRNGGIESDILLLSPMCDLSEARQAVALDIICAIGSPESATILDLAAQENEKRARAHLALDTGFGRFGFLPDDIGFAIKAVEDLEHVDIEGIFSHLSNSFGKNPKDSDTQYRLFMKGVEQLRAAGIQTGMLHLCNSCAFLRFEHMHLDAVRVGSAFLGRLPMPNRFGLHKIGYIESAVCEVKTLPKGYNIGYANTYRTKAATRIAVIPIGYKDGFGVAKVNDAFRFLDICRYIYHDGMSFFKNNSIYVEIGGKKCKLLGRISMFNVIADVSGMDVQVGDPVTMQCNPIMIDSSIEREYR